MPARLLDTQEEKQLEGTGDWVIVRSTEAQASSCDNLHSVLEGTGLF